MKWSGKTAAQRELDRHRSSLNHEEVTALREVLKYFKPSTFNYHPGIMNGERVIDLPRVVEWMMDSTDKWFKEKMKEERVATLKETSRELRELTEKAEDMVKGKKCPAAKTKCMTDECVSWTFSEKSYNAPAQISCAKGYFKAVT